MFLYRNILKQSLKISWKNKYLWFFGLFAAFLGNGGDFEIIFRQSENEIIPKLKSFVETGIFSGNTLVNIGILTKNDPVTAIVFFIIFLVISISICFLIWLSIISQSVLVKNSAKIIASKTVKKIAGFTMIKEGILREAKNFWKIFGLNIFLKLMVILLFLIISLPIIILTKKIAYSASMLFIILFIILMPIALMFSFIIKYAICFAIIKEKSFVDSIKEGWSLFVKNWLVSIEMAFILFFINFLFGFIIILFLLILAVPFLFFIFAISEFLYLINFWFVAIFGFILIMIVIMGGGAMLSTFQIASWTGMYIKLMDKEGVSKLERIAEKFKKKK